MVKNRSEEAHDLTTTDWSIEDASPLNPLFPQYPSSPIASLIVGLITGVTGTCANAVDFVAMANVSHEVCFTNTERVEHTSQGFQLSSSPRRCRLFP